MSSRRSSSDEVMGGEEVKLTMKGDGDDYSKYLDFNFSDPSSFGLPLSNTTSTFPDFPTTDNLPFSHPDSALTSLLSSFDVPTTDRTNLVSDFSSPDVGEYQLGDDEMLFPLMDFSTTTTTAISTTQKWDTHTQQPRINTPMFGNESAFDDVNFSMLDEHGVFGLPLFGGIPNASTTTSSSAVTGGGGQQQQHSPRLQNSDSSGGSGEDGILTTTQMEQLIAAADGLTQSDVGRDINIQRVNTPVLNHQHALTASPAEVFAKMSSTPVMDVHDSFESRAPMTIDTTCSPSLGTVPMPTSTGPVRSTSGGSVSRKRKSSSKPYEPTGTRSSRPLLDPTAPTQTKTYLAPGSTTRKLIPVGFQKRLKLDSSTPIDASVVGSEVLDEIDEKRRKNCLAARESRKRKMDYLNGLKGRIGEWEEWARNVESLLGDKFQLPPMPDFHEIEE